MVEQYIKKREALAENEKDVQESEEGFYEISDDDLKEFNDLVDSQKEKDASLMEGGVD